MTTSTTKKRSNPPLITRRLAVFLIGMALAETSTTLTMVQVPVYLREQGADISQIGFFFTMAMIFPLVLRILGGWLSDSIGRIRALAIGSIAGSMAYVAYALAPDWRYAIIGPTFLAITTALVAPSYKAHIADVAPQDGRARIYGISEAVITAAWIVGPPLGGVIAQRLSYRWMFLCAALTFLCAAAIFLILRSTGKATPYTPPGKPTLRSLRSSLLEMLALVLSGGLVAWLLITDGVRDVAAKMSFDLMPVYLSDIAGLSKQSIGFLDGIFGLALAAASIPAGWLIDKTSERLGVVLGMVMLIASRLAFALSSSFGGFAFSWSLLGIGAGLMDPAYSSLIAKGVPAHLRGITFGLLTTSLGIISLPFPWIGSQIWTHFGPKAPFFTTVVLASLAIIPAWFKLIAPKEPPNGESTLATQQ
jgi:MFS family permease